MARKMKTMDGNQASRSRIVCVYRSRGNLPDHTVIRYAGAR